MAIDSFWSISKKYYQVPLKVIWKSCIALLAMSTRYTNAVVNEIFEPPHTFKKEDGSEGVAVPTHFAGIEKDEVIPREWLEKMDKWQHELESSIHWDQGDVLIIDNYAAQHARWAWEGDRKILASFWDQPGMTGVPIMA